MTNPAFLLCDDHLTYDTSKLNLCTNDPVICYGPPVPVPPPAPSSSGSTGGGGGGGWIPVHVIHRNPDGALLSATMAPETAHSVEMPDGKIIKIHPENVIDATELEGLRQEVEKYRREVDDLRRAAIPRRERIDTLRRRILELERVIDNIRSVMIQQGEQLTAQAEMIARQKPWISTDALADMIAEAMAANPMLQALQRELSALGSAPAHEGVSISRLISAAAVGLATCYLVPDDAPLLKVAGYSAAAALAASAIEKR